MKVVEGLSGVDVKAAPSVLTVGNFDGVHRGHQAIIRTARSLADASGLPVAALTFEPHPISVLRPDVAPQRLGTVAQKLAALAAAGVDVAVVAESTPALFAIEAETFLREVLVRRFEPRFIVEGNNFRFGHDRAGDIATLERHAADGGYRVRVVDPVMQRLADGREERISSSLVRRLIAEGQVEWAAEALGRAYLLSGRVVRGAARGRRLGFPTANVEVAGVLVPADGVYAGWADFSGVRRPAAISIGRTPTFAGDVRQVEAHLLDFDGDLYGNTVGLHVAHRLRGQRRFETVDALVAQVRADIVRVRELMR